MSDFTVYRRDNEDRSRYVASCVYLDDAITILGRWRGGMILDGNGRTIVIRKEAEDDITLFPCDEDRGACDN